MKYVLLPLKRYADFFGRSARKEFWFFLIAMIVGTVLLSLIEQAAGLDGRAFGTYGPFSLVYLLLLIVPMFAVQARRFHDQDRSAWWLLLHVAPFALAFVPQSPGPVWNALYLLPYVVLLVFMAIDGTRGPNRFGADPRGRQPR